MAALLPPPLPPSLPFLLNMEVNPKPPLVPSAVVQDKLSELGC